MSSIIAPLAPGSLWGAIQETSEKALRCGAIVSIDTRQEFLEEGGIRFLLQVATSLARKNQDQAQNVQQAQSSEKGSSPFLPPESELTVGRVSPTHLAILNKFNVLDYHLLIVTEYFEDQHCLLNQADLAALWRCLAEYEGLGFYNGGTIAGASQTHKHLQLVPLPMAESGPALPIEALLSAAPAGAPIDTVPALPFRHAFARLDPSLRQNPDEAARVTYELYTRMLAAGGLSAHRSDNCQRQSDPYNLLVTRDWMLLVPRTQEGYAGISINSLGYAGSLFVRSSEELETVKQVGPMKILEEVSVPIR